MRVLGQQQHLQFILELIDALCGVLGFLLGHFFQAFILVAQQFLRVGEVFHEASVLLEFFHDGLQLRVFLGKRCKPGLVLDNFRIRKRDGNFLMPLLEGLELVEN